MVDGGAVPAAGPIRILVAEDNVTNQKLCQRIFEKAGFDVVLADNGAAALEVLGKQEVDIILMDCQMPVLDGYEATRRLRAHPDPQIARVPVVALTAHAMDGDRQKCLDAGMDEYVSKPFNRQHLLDTVRRLANRR